MSSNIKARIIIKKICRHLIIIINRVWHLFIIAISPIKNYNELSMKIYNLNEMSMQLFHEKHELIRAQELEIIELRESLRNLREESMQLFHEKHELIRAQELKIIELRENHRNQREESMQLLHEKHELFSQHKIIIDTLIEKLNDLQNKSLQLFHEKHEMIRRQELEIIGLKEGQRNLREKSMQLFHEKHEMILNDRNDIQFIISRIIILQYLLGAHFLKEHKNLVEYLDDNNGLFMYPYKFTQSYFSRNTEIFESCDELFYYVIEDGKKLYFEKKFFSRKDVEKYYNFLVMEQDDESPHCYFNNSYQFINGYNFIDVGAAEGLISLRLIDKAKKVILIENDIKWEKSLKKTFENYDNVELIFKSCSSRNLVNNVALEYIISAKNDYYIKIDVEGNERDVLDSIDYSVLSGNSKLLICTYHNQLDYDMFVEYLNKVGRDYITTEGYVLSNWGGYKEPYFRKALLKTV